MSARGWSENLKLAILLANSGLAETTIAAYQAFQAADSYRDKIAATHPLQLDLAELADRYAGGAKPRDFDESIDYAAEAERKFGDGKIVKWLLALMNLVNSLPQGSTQSDLAGT